MTEYEKQKKEEDKKSQLEILSQKQPHPKPKISLGSLSKTQSDQKLSHETRSDLKARL
jgi:hypothetical protein